MGSVLVEEQRPSREPVKTHVDSHGCAWAIHIKGEGYLVMRVRRSATQLSEGVAWFDEVTVQRAADIEEV